MAEIVSHQSFEKWIGRLRLTDTWADVVFLQAVDDSQEASKLLGVSLMEGDHGCSALVPMAMWKHFHFWPLIPLESCALEQVSLHVSPGAELRLGVGSRNFSDVKHWLHGRLLNCQRQSW